MDVAGEQDFGVGECCFKIAAKPRVLSGNRREAPLSCLPVTGRGVEQDQRKPAVVECRFDAGGRMIIGVQEFHGLKSGVSGSLKALKKGKFCEQKGKVGGGAGHEVPGGLFEFCRRNDPEKFPSGPNAKPFFAIDFTLNT